MVVVNTTNHQQEALAILRKYGADDYSKNSNAAATRTAYTQQPSNYVQSDNYVPPAVNQPTNQPNTAPPVNQQAANVAGSDEYQRLQAQLQSMQAQLREAQTQLQAAREHESQLRTVRERDTQAQSMRQQIQDLQAQLQATQAELRVTQDRIAKANQ